MQLLDEEGHIMQIYGFDEFGVELPTDDILAVNANGTNNSTVTGLHNNRQQPFSFTGYQMDEAGEMYFAQARRYDAEVGRFVSEDNIAGWTNMPFTLNRYNYCWNRPNDYVDLDGRFPWILIPLVIVSLGLTGCSSQNDYVPCPEGEGKDDGDLNLTNGYNPVYDVGYYNTDEYLFYTNCYAYAFGMLVNPLTGEKFPLGGNQPGLLSNDKYFLETTTTEGEIQYRQYYLAGTEESNVNLVNVVKADMDAVGLNFTEYEDGMTGGKRIALVVSPYISPESPGDYHWYVFDEESQSWYNKNGKMWATNNKIYVTYDMFYEQEVKYGDEIMDYKEYAQALGYSVFVGEFYLSKKSGGCIE